MGKHATNKKSRGSEVMAQGVLTRAKTLALYGAAPAFAYLELRSRRLEKRISAPKKKQSKCERQNPNPRRMVRANVSPRVSNRANSRMKEKKRIDGEKLEEVSLGDNAPELETGRDERETTPCNLIREPESVTTPGSSTKRTKKSTPGQTGSTSQRVIPSTQEIEDLFINPEQQQQQNFTEKYNFDPVKEQPLPGRYQWVKLKP